MFSDFKLTSHKVPNTCKLMRCLQWTHDLL